LLTLDALPMLSWVSLGGLLSCTEPAYLRRACTNPAPPPRHPTMESTRPHFSCHRWGQPWLGVWGDRRQWEDLLFAWRSGSLILVL